MSRETNVATLYNPVLDGDVLRIPGIKAISVDGVPLRGRSGVHVEIGHCYIFGICDECVPVLRSVVCSVQQIEPLPKLWLPPRYAINKHILRLP